MKNRKIEVKWAFLFVAMMLVWMLLERLVGLHDTYIEQHGIFTNLVAIPAIAIYVFALREKCRKYYNGAMSYKEGVIAGTIMTLIIAALTPLVQYITSTWITPDFFANITAYSVSAGLRSAAEAEAEFNLQNYMIMATVGALIMGMLTTVIVAWFTKGSKPADAPAAPEEGYAM